MLHKLRAKSITIVHKWYKNVSLYPDRYTWSEGVSDDGKEYHSILKLSL